jgi:hypothetical protein
MFSGTRTRFFAIGAAAIAIAGGAYGIVAATAGRSSGAATTATSSPAISGRSALGGRGSNARSGPAAGGTSGTVDSAFTSSFTLSTSTGQKVTVETTSSTTYRKGESSTSASAIERGESVVVLGTVDGTTIKASEIIAQPTGVGGSTTDVVPFERGAQSTSKQVGQVPSAYTQGSGTIVGGTMANKATEAALAAYSGGIVNRVVKLSSGEYEVHNVGVNWPHHIFVDHNFEVVGAN